MHIPSSILSLIFLFIATTAFGQNFTKITIPGSKGAYASQNAWLDYDNDGDLDFIVCGARETNTMETQIYQNTGGDNFQIAPAPFGSLPQFGESDITFINTNQDDRVDVMLMGRRIGSPTTNRIALLENRTTGFTDIGPLPQRENASGYEIVAAGDVNNDGTTDLFVSGANGFINGNPNLQAFIYLNINNAWVRTTCPDVVAVYIGDAQFADIDNDGDLDLVASGSDGAFPYQNTRTYINDGTGFFELGQVLFPLQNSSVDFGDYDNDNDVDIIMTGYDEWLSPTTRLLVNNGHGTFADTPVNPALNRTAGGSAKWGDYDNDGDLDILMTGETSSAKSLAIFTNTAGSFDEVTDDAFEMLGSGAASWGDYDKDGDLDILVTGQSDPGVPVLYILKNNGGTKNTAPTRPTNLTYSIVGDEEIKLEWSNATDDFTPAGSLTYNLSVHNNEGKLIMQPFSFAQTGARKIVSQGNVGSNLSWTLTFENDGMYTVNVQAIDGGFMASEWSAQKMVFIGVPASPESLTLTYVNGKIQLTWQDKSINEEYFVIEKSVNNGVFTEIQSVSHNTTIFEEQYSGFNIHTYRVVAKNPNGSSPYTNTVETVMAAPTNLSADLDGDELELNWTDNSYQEQFFVIEQSVAGGAFVKIDSVSSNLSSYTLTLQADTYSFRVNASNPNQRTGYSNDVDVVITGAEEEYGRVLTIYPNPAKALAMIANAERGTSLEVFVTTPGGATLFSGNIAVDANGEAVLPVDNLSPGFYLVNCKLRGRMANTLKLVKH